MLAEKRFSFHITRKILLVVTQEALIIKIAHKTAINKMPLLLLTLVNSNCYCGHLEGEKKTFFKNLNK